ncbi:MAG: hemerythrin domain-containing protein [Nocardioides sp.]
MAIDSMNKVIHAAVRRDLGRLETALSTVADGDRDRAAGLGRAWDNLDRQLRHHHQQEDSLLFPAMSQLGVDGSLLSTLEGEHETMGRALDEIDTTMRSYATSASATDAAAAADAVRRGLPVVEIHLAHEEAELEPLMQPHLESAQWKAVERQLRKQPPTRTGWFFAWIQDGASAEVMGYLGSAVPAPVRFVFANGFGRGYQKSVAAVWR